LKNKIINKFESNAAPVVILPAAGVVEPSGREGVKTMKRRKMIVVAKQWDHRGEVDGSVMKLNVQSAGRCLSVQVGKQIGMWKKSLEHTFAKTS
jgi:hypothetical protein